MEIFHGGCHGCVNQAIRGIGYCDGCMYKNKTNRSLPNLFRSQDDLLELKKLYEQIFGDNSNRLAGTRCLPKQEPRIETGLVKFGDDWTGVFIRGDDANWYGALLKNKMSGVLDPFYNHTLENLANLLSGVR